MFGVEGTQMSNKTRIMHMHITSTLQYVAPIGKSAKFLYVGDSIGLTMGTEKTLSMLGSSYKQAEFESRNIKVF